MAAKEHRVMHENNSRLFYANYRSKAAGAAVPNVHLGEFSHSPSFHSGVSAAPSQINICQGIFI
jgi:hypothetical protein